jgi:hypothetical protein
LGLGVVTTYEVAAAAGSEPAGRVACVQPHAAQLPELARGALKLRGAFAQVMVRSCQVVFASVRTCQPGAASEQSCETYSRRVAPVTVAPFGSEDRSNRR